MALIKTKSKGKKTDDFNERYYNMTNVMVGVVMMMTTMTMITTSKN